MSSRATYLIGYSRSFSIYSRKQYIPSFNLVSNFKKYETAYFRHLMHTTLTHMIRVLGKFRWSRLAGVLTVTPAQQVLVVCSIRTDRVDSSINKVTTHEKLAHHDHLPKWSCGFMAFDTPAWQIHSPWCVCMCVTKHDQDKYSRWLLLPCLLYTSPSPRD